jgi:N-acetyl-alpha-D-muramate 1-phosphate uridylyltransferase
VVLAAGLGTRLLPLTELRPKALCPVNNVALVDHGIERLRPHVSVIAVNAHHHAEQMTAHLADRDVHVSIEEGEPLGTAGAVGNLRPWIDGRAVAVTNGDAWHPGTVDALLDGWDGSTLRLLVTHDPTRADFGEWRFAGTSVMPWEMAKDLQPEPTGLYEVLWSQVQDLELVELDGEFFDCGTPRDYLLANLAASGGESVVAPTAVVEGEVERSVVWPGSRVERGERLVESIRAGSLTVTTA